jgi:exodeoxyribonuclease VII large subunit
VEFFNSVDLVDVIILGRGGGSVEDLWAFNDEALARTVAASRLPIISAVGHESDVSICDFVADLRAPTPSAAAEAAVPDAEELKQILTQKYARLQHATRAKLQRLRNTLSAKESNRMLRSPQELFDVRRMHLIMREERLQHLTDKGLARKRGAFVTAAARLEGLSPLSVLTRGYAMVTDEAQRTLTGAEQLSVGQHVRLHFSNGEADAVVEDVTTAKNNSRKDA